ncbi:40S ribosomal protein S13 [Galemys pyrenaicus]|uniref:40S ribosomal protein S13 n=1 Tax=Galemys pyrenaicus TaxID=202257 RepID=A0A8J6AVD1_GALPY|nr:40S ribosomal protein S13 [Galemys pyrenaicus]
MEGPGKCSKPARDARAHDTRARAEGRAGLASGRGTGRQHRARAPRWRPQAPRRDPQTSFTKGPALAERLSPQSSGCCGSVTLLRPLLSRHRRAVGPRAAAGPGRDASEGVAEKRSPLPSLGLARDGLHRGPCLNWRMRLDRSLPAICSLTVAGSSSRFLDLSFPFSLTELPGKLNPVMPDYHSEGSWRPTCSSSPSLQAAFDSSESPFFSLELFFRCLPAAIMGRMHAPGKGLSQSALPYRRSAPTWLKLTSDYVKEQIYKLAKKGLTPSRSV